MDVANKKGGMVIGTGDMSELALGWATYNGDHMSMYGVNASVPKTLVRHLVRYYADTCGDEKLAGVLYDVLDTPVSPELLPPEDGKISQKTEDLVGPYELHDFYMYDWHDSEVKGRQVHGYTHARCARENAIREFGINELEQKIVFCHMFPLNITRVPARREAIYVCVADKICATLETLKKIDYNYIASVFDRKG